MRWVILGLALALGAGCAPTTLSPVVMRLSPGDMERGSSGLLGLHTGPRLSTPISAGRSGGLGGGTTFTGDKNVFSIPQWGLAYDVTLNVPLPHEVMFHAGAQGEFFYPLPLPAYGLYMGVSRYIALGRASIAPALVGSVATDFGLSTSGSSGGSQVGGELSVAIAWHPEDRITVGVVPFGSYQHLWTGGTDTFALYTGAVVVVRLQYIPNNGIELSGGYGRVFMPDGTSWNAPIVGVRLGQ